MVANIFLVNTGLCPLNVHSRELNPERLPMVAHVTVADGTVLRCWE